MQELGMLQEKLDHLLRRYAALKTENGRLRDTVQGQARTIGQLEEQLAKAGQQIMAVQLGNTVLEPEEKEAMRRQLDQVIAEIDKLLTSLND